MDSQATTTERRAPASSPFALRWNVLAFLLDFNISIMLNFLSFYSSRERRIRKWYSDLRLAAAKKRKKAAKKMKSEKFEQYYQAGKPLFTRAAILDMATQIASGQQVIHYDDYLGLAPRQQECRLPTGRDPEEHASYKWSIGISYSSYEKLKYRNPRDVEVTFDYYPVSFSYQRRREFPILNDLEQIRSNFITHGDPWLNGDECRAIIQPLLSHPSSRKIRKIVAFALGSMAHADTSVLPRWAAQHALIMGLADALQKSHHHSIKCFAQEPIYEDADKVFLSEKGITVLNDPMAFLEVDEETLVISISPNVCVRQILADLVRPAAMIWDEVTPREPEENEWKTKIIDGMPIVVTPYTTDPNSERVRDMIRGYDQLRFLGNDTNFGRLATYIKKDDPVAPSKYSKENPESKI